MSWVQLFFHFFLVYICAFCAAAATWPCESEQTEAGVPLYLFQVSAHCRPVALQRKPRYSTLAKRKGRGYFRDGFIEDIIIPILPPIRAQSQCGGVRFSGGGTFFFTSFFNLDLLSHSSELTWGGKCMKKGGVEGVEAACGCLYCGEIIPDEPIRLGVSLNCGFFNLQGSIFGAIHVQQQVN